MIEIIYMPDNATKSTISMACREQNMKVLEAMNEIKHDRIQADIRKHACSGYVMRGKTIVQFYTGDYRHGGFGAFVRYASKFSEHNSDDGRTVSLKSIDDVVSKLLNIKEPVDDKQDGQGEVVSASEPCGPATGTDTI